MKAVIAVCVITAGIILCAFQQQAAPRRGTNQETSNATQRKSDAKPQPTTKTSSSTPPAVKPDEHPNGIESNSNQNVEVVMPAPDDPTARGIGVIGLLCTAALTGVGIYGIRIALKTLGEMKRQREEMEKQVKAMRDQIALQFRPRILVREVEASQFSVGDEPMECELKFTIVNSGSLPAYVTGGQLQLISCIENVMTKHECTEGDPHFIPAFTFQPGQSVTYEQTLSTGVMWSVDWANFLHGIESLTKGPRSITLSGIVEYLDDLKIPRRTGIKRRYAPKTKTFYPLRDSEGEYAD